MKKCGHCGIEQPLEQFALKFGKPQWQCKTCQKEYRRQHYLANRQKYIDKAGANRIVYRDEFIAWLSDKSCIDCGNSDVRVLEFDHLRDKSFNVTDKIGVMRLASFMDEIAKCEIVCANCHRIRTHERLDSARNRYVLEV